MKWVSLYTILFFLLITPVQSSNDYYQSVFLGERIGGLYYGPLSPELKFSGRDGSIQFVDDLFYRNYARPLIIDELFLLTDAWFEDISQVSSCPNHYLSENIHYIRYLFRLLTMSYLFESMKQTHLNLHALGFDRNACSLSWHQIFSQCAPQTEDMKKFVQRTQFRYLRDITQADYRVLDDSDKRRWFQSFSKEKQKQTSKDLSRQRLISWCSESAERCDNLKLEGVRDILVSSCQEDRELIQTICSEQDSLYGVSYVGELRELIEQSHVMAILNRGGHGKGCLERYVRVFKRNEQSYPFLSPLVPRVRDHLKEREASYAQGALFLPGALQEFDSRGLDNFLFVDTTPEPEPQPVVVEEPVVEPEPVVVVEEPVAPPVPVIIADPLPEPPPRTAFAHAYDRLVERNRDRVIVNMEQFKDDFVFTERMISALKGPLEDYQTREALEDMLQYDLLGTKVEPMRLMFLKFLIDNQMHQGLYNIMSVIGSQFYVLNDIDGEGGPVAVEINNNAQTNHRWEITLLRDDQVVNEKILE